MPECKELKQKLLKISREITKDCPFCTLVSEDIENRTPIYCSRFSGERSPIPVDLDTCLSCGEFKRHG
ncbi:MAG: hypothetical protein H0Z33_15320 [Bacillaceae bacterium]|nr:hypothetical protein [Bacillaceae bacterium]